MPNLQAGQRTVRGLQTLAIPRPRRNEDATRQIDRRLLFIDPLPGSNPVRKTSSGRFYSSRKSGIRMSRHLRKSTAVRLRHLQFFALGNSLLPSAAPACFASELISSGALMPDTRNRPPEGNPATTGSSVTETSRKIVQFVSSGSISRVKKRTRQRVGCLNRPSVWLMDSDIHDKNGEECGEIIFPSAPGQSLLQIGFPESICIY